MSGRGSAKGWAGACALLCILALPARAQAAEPDNRTNQQQRLLQLHNIEREALGIRPLKWNQKLVDSALAWGRHLVQIGYLEHYQEEDGDLNPEGENLWLGTIGAYSLEEMVGLWVDEKRNYKPGRFPANSLTGDPEDIGHYTQMIWATTTDVGCALLRGKEDDFLVCRYLEGGNVIGERAH